MRGQRKLGDTERAMVEEAARLLAFNGCSSSAMSDFGFSKVNILRNHARVDNLLASSLPCAPLALLWPSVMAQNIGLIDGCLPRDAGDEAKHRLVLAFDFTYLMPMHSFIRLHDQKGLVGSPFAMSDLSKDVSETSSFQQIRPGEPLTENTKANRMCLRRNAILLRQYHL